MGLIERNARAIELYLIVYDQIHKSAAGSEVPAGKEAKGTRQYAAPISSKGFDHLVDSGNLEAATFLAPIFRTMRREAFPYYYACGLVAGWYVPQVQGLPDAEHEQREEERVIRERELLKTRRKENKFKEMKRSERFKAYLKTKQEERAKTKKQAEENPLEPEPLPANAPPTPRERVEARRAAERAKLAAELDAAATPSIEEADHGILRRWEAKESKRDADALAVFKAACRWAAERLPEGTSLSVSAKGGRQAKTATQGAAMDRWERQQEQRAETCRKRYEQFREIERANPDATREAAKDMWSKRYHRSVRSLEDAIRLCEKGEWPDGELAQTREERRKRGS